MERSLLIFGDAHGFSLGIEYVSHRPLCAGNPYHPSISQWPVGVLGGLGEILSQPGGSSPHSNYFVSNIIFTRAVAVGRETNVSF
jgi:hypothetical protein